jgi:hypothetical protein
LENRAGEDEQAKGDQYLSHIYLLDDVGRRGSRWRALPLASFGYGVPERAWV